MGFFSQRGGREKGTRKSTSQRPDKAIKCTFSISEHQSLDDRIYLVQLLDSTIHRINHKPADK